VVWAAAAGFASLALYLATLQPGFGGPEDTPKFQFLGYVLGTAHPPGYPLYVWLSHLFVMLPIGTIAYRANLFSAVMAALACAVAFVMSRQIGAGRWASLCAALALAAGASFWKSAVFAEVYSLAAVMAALTVSLLLAWNARPGALRILAATGALALGLGNHLTIIGIIPACVLYVLLRHRRVVTPRLIAAASVIVLLGVAQYGLIIIRTHQGAPYLESRASSVRDLIGVVTAERFAGQRFAFGPWVLLTDHLPALASVIGRELGIAGALLLAAGLVSASRRRNGGTALLIGSAAGMLGMVLNLTGDLNGFITPVMVLLWPVAALGVDALAKRLRGLRGTASIAGVTAITAAAVMPLANIAANYRDADQSEHTAPARFFRSAFRQLPDRAGVVVEDYFYDMAIDYLSFTGEAGPRRGIVRTGFDAAEVRAAAQGTGGPSGRPRRVFAFAGGALFLGTDGLHFDRADIAGTPLSDWLLGLPRKTIIVFATAYVPGPLDLTGPEHSHARPLGRPRAFEAFAIRAGTTDAAWRGNDEGVSMTVGPDVLVSSPAFAGALVASADAAGARIVLAGQEIASVSDGLALAVFSPDGKFLRSDVFHGSEPVRVPFQEALYELTGEAPCVALGNEWRDVSPALVTGSWIATLQTIGSVVIETAISPASGSLRAQSTQLMGDGSTGTTASSANADGAQVIATGMSRSSERRPVFRFSMDRPAVQARARVRPSGAQTTVTVCSHQPSRPLFESGSNAGILKADFESEAYYGAGWSGAERNDAGPFRRGEQAATLLLPLTGPFTYHVSLDVTSANEASIALAVDGQPAGTCEPRLNVRCVLTLPVTALRAGVTALTLERIGPPHDPRGPAMIFRGARLDRRPGVDAAPAR
jgi:Protein of unknown function (DUF2723)